MGAEWCFCAILIPGRGKAFFYSDAAAQCYGYLAPWSCGDVSFGRSNDTLSAHVGSAGALVARNRSCCHCHAERGGKTTAEIRYQKSASGVRQGKVAGTNPGLCGCFQGHYSQSN